MPVKENMPPQCSYIDEQHNMHRGDMSTGCQQEFQVRLICEPHFIILSFNEMPVLLGKTMIIHIGNCKPVSRSTVIVAIIFIGRCNHLYLM